MWIGSIFLVKELSVERFFPTETKEFPYGNGIKLIKTFKVKTFKTFKTFKVKIFQHVEEIVPKDLSITKSIFNN